MKRAIVMLSVSAIALAGCGLQGELERPEPLAGARQDRDLGTRRPVTPQENIDPASTVRPPRSDPLPGTNDPVGRSPSITP